MHSTLLGPSGGLYDMIGINWNYDAGMWLFNTTQNVKTISFDMSKSTGGNAIGGGGAGWAFYTPPGLNVPEPSSALLACCGLIVAVSRTERRRT